VADRVVKKRLGRGRHSDQFKRRAVALMAVGDKTLKEISAQLGVSVVSLIKWRRDLQQPRATPAAPLRPDSDPPNSAAPTEIERLRRELARVTEERDRLRKSLALLIGAM
jgi:transposase-like protein